MLERELGIPHPGVVQHDHVGLGAAFALAMVRRRLDLGDHTGIGTELGHQQDHTQNTDMFDEPAGATHNKKRRGRNELTLTIVQKAGVHHKHGTAPRRPNAAEFWRLLRRRLTACG